MKLVQIISSAIALLIATTDAAEVQKEGEMLKLDTKEARTVVEANKSIGTGAYTFLLDEFLE